MGIAALRGGNIRVLLHWRKTFETRAERIGDMPIFGVRVGVPSFGVGRSGRWYRRHRPGRRVRFEHGAAFVALRRCGVVDGFALRAGLEMQRRPATVAESGAVGIVMIAKTTARKRHDAENGKS